MTKQLIVAIRFTPESATSGGADKPFPYEKLTNWIDKTIDKWGQLNNSTSTLIEVPTQADIDYQEYTNLIQKNRQSLVPALYAYKVISFDPSDVTVEFNLTKILKLSATVNPNFFQHKTLDEFSEDETKVSDLMSGFFDTFSENFMSLIMKEAVRSKVFTETPTLTFKVFNK